MDSWIRAILRIYEFTAIFVITIIPALATVYAIIVSFLGRIVKRAKEEFERVKEEVEAEITAREKKLLKKRGRKSKTVKEALAEIEDLRKELKKLEKEQKSREEKLKNLSFSCIFVRPAGWALGGLFSIFIAYGWFNVVPSSWLGVWIVAPSVFLYLLGLAFVSVGVFRFIIPRLKDVDRFAREPEETPLEKMEGILRKQTERSREEYRKTFDRLIGKMDEVVRALLPKEPKFEVHFLKDNELVDNLVLKKGLEEWATLDINNDSRFTVEEAMIHLALSQGFALRKKLDDEPEFRPAHLSLYPGGTKLHIDIGTMMALSELPISFLIKGEESGEDFEMTIWINSTSHKRYEATLKVIVIP